jgi:regulator of protease activity HflC (stomatin/prohibitin superfamily)
MRVENALFCALFLAAAGCASTVVEPGHRGLLFDPKHGGLAHGVLQPGYYKHSGSARIEDFDITYSTHKEDIHTTSQEGLTLDLRLALIYRPVISELYELDTEIGLNYYDEVVGPEFRSAARGVFARHSYLDLMRNNEKIEDEIEVELRRRIRGKHVEISSITMEAVGYAPEIARAVQAKLVGEQEAIRQKAALESESIRRKAELEHQAEQAKLEADAAIRSKHTERALAEEQAAIDKVTAENDTFKAKAEAEQRKYLAQAHAAEQRAVSPLEVMIHAYDALGKLGGSGTTIMLGDWSHVPNFLFPQMAGFQTAGVSPGGGARGSAPGR